MHTVHPAILTDNPRQEVLSRRSTKRDEEQDYARVLCEFLKRVQKREVEDRFNRGADEQKRCVDADDEITRSPD